MKQPIPVRLKSFLVCASLATSLAACATPAAAPVPAPAQPAALAPTTAPQVPELAIEFTGTEFKLPADVPGGIVAVTVNNTSGKPMAITMLRLRPGKTADEMLKWYEETPLDFASGSQLASVIFSLSAISPGDPERLIADLKTGEFLLDATEPADGPPSTDVKYITHMFTADKAVGTTEPKADVTAEMNDFAFVMPDEIKAGKQMWRVSNTGKQFHLMLVLKPNENVNPEAVVKAMMDETQSGAPPFEVVTEVAPMGDGQQQWVEVDLPPGTYVVVCPVPDVNATGGPPVSHLAHGMHKTLVVK